MAAPNLRSSAKSLLFLIAIAAVLFAVDVVVYVASSGALNRAGKELSAREEQVANSRKIAQRLEFSRDQYVEAHDRLRLLERSVSPAAYIPTLLKQLENTGRQVHLKVLAVRPRPEPVAPVNSAANRSGNPEEQQSATSASPPPRKRPAPKTYDTLHIDIEVEGSYWNTMAFLQRLTEFPKIVAVDGLQIMPTAQPCSPRTSPLLTIQLSLRAFVFPEDSGPTPDVSIKPVGQAAQPVTGSVEADGRNGRSEHEAG